MINEKLTFKDIEFSYLAEGTSRKVYISSCKRFVLKTPLSENPIDVKMAKTANLIEFENYTQYMYDFKGRVKNALNLIQPAKCIYFSETPEFLIMEFVQEISSNRRNEETSVYRHQVGYNSKGELVVFDAS